MDQIELGIVDTRNIIKILNEVYRHDFSNYALTALRRGFEGAIVKSNLQDVDALLHRLKTDESYFPEFIYHFLIRSTEMFRDPSLWRVLKNEFLPEQIKRHATYKIWHPNVIGGHELYSLMIVLKEADLIDKTQVFASGVCPKCIEEIKSGTFRRKIFDVSSENYIRYQGITDFAQYAWIEGDMAKRDTHLIDKVKFVDQDLMFKQNPENINLILFRNNLIYYNQTLQDKVLDIMHNALALGGHLIIGAMELVTGTPAKKFVPLNETESIYKKR